MEFNRFSNPDEDPKKKKPPPKNASPEDLKPINTITWVNLSEFLNPGTIHIKQRCSLMLKETYEKGLEEDKNDKVLNKLNKNVNDDLSISKRTDISKQIDTEKNEKVNVDIFQQAKTYIYIKISLSSPINPALPKEEKKGPNIAKEERSYNQLSSEDICLDLRKQLKIAIETITKVKFINNY